nr:immunoglobulin light chain junction region [Macaca mulatta]
DYYCQSFDGRNNVLF